MRHHTGTTWGWVAALLPLSTLIGCQSTQTTAREEAVLRWNEARARVKAKLAADQFAAGNVDAAADELSAASQLQPNNPELVSLRARILLAEGQTDEAGRILEQAEQRDGPDAERAYLLGIVRQQQLRWDEALAAYQQAADLDPSRVDYAVAAAQLWLQLGEPQAALNFLEERERAFIWVPSYQAVLGEAYEQVGNWSAAASAWQRVLYADGGDAPTRRRLAQALVHAQRYVEAIPLLEDLTNETPPESALLDHTLLAECYLAEGRNEAAQLQAQQVLQREPTHVPALRLLAHSLGEAGNHAGALRVARRALGIDQDDILSLELTAALAWRMRDTQLAGRTTKRLLALEPDNRVGQQIVQRLRMQMGTPE